MDDHQRRQATLFVGAAYAVHTDEQGLPDDPSQALEIRSLADQAIRINNWVDVDGDHGRRVHNAARAWLKLYGHCRGGNRDPKLGAAWIAARGAMPDYWDLLGLEPPEMF